MLQEIKSIYEDNCRWLLFAEAKHTVLLAFHIAFLSLVLSDYDIVKILLDNQNIIVIILCAINICLDILSMIPFLNNNEILETLVRKYNADKWTSCSVIFYKDIFMMGAKYDSALRERLGIQEYSLIEYEWVNQIKEIATITTIKTTMFKWIGISTVVNILFFVYMLLH